MILKVKKVFLENKKIFFCVIIVLWFLTVYALNIILDIKKTNLIGAILIACTSGIFNYLVLNSLKKTNKIKWSYIFTAIIIIGIILRTTYILNTSITERQHDMEEKTGHMAYIETIYNTGKLPDNNNWQFYQQPLHHIISAIWLKLNTTVGIDLDTAKEGIQILTAIYSSLIILISYLILKELKIDDKIRALVLIIIAVHPTFIILAGSVNNDILMIMFTFLDLLYLIKWYKLPNWKNTIILSLSVALGAITKISSTIIAIPILYIFINKFIEEYKNSNEKKAIIENYLKKMIVFGTIALTIGLSFSFRNKLKFNQSIFFVPTPGQITYCGDHSWFDRFNIISKELLEVYCNPFEDCNIISYIVKSSLFGEYNLNLTQYENKINILEMVLIMVNVFLIGLSLVGLIKTIKKHNKDKIINIFTIFYFVQLIMYLYANIIKPYACTMDFRYIVPTIFLGMIFVALNANNSNNKILLSMVIIFCILSIFVELTTLNLLTIRI